MSQIPKGAISSSPEILSEGFAFATQVTMKSCWLAAGIIAFAFGDTILPEVQATVGGNAKREMYKGVSMGYSILLTSYMVVAIAGYWAFGYNVRFMPFLSTPTSSCTLVDFASC